MERFRLFTAAGIATRCPYYILALAFFGLLATSAAADESARYGVKLGYIGDEFYQRLALDWREVREQQFLASMMAGPEIVPRKKKKSLDLTPLADWAIGYVQNLGVPLVEHRDEGGERPIAVSAHFSLAEDSPDVRLHLGDRPAEPMGAFYPPEKGFRFSVSYPINDLSLRLEAGDDSEFGSLAVGGLSWVHPNKRLAAGVGLPIKLDNSDSDFGAIFQIRMKLR